MVTELESKTLLRKSFAARNLGQPTLPRRAHRFVKKIIIRKDRNVKIRLRTSAVNKKIFYSIDKGKINRGKDAQLREK